MSAINSHTKRRIRRDADQRIRQDQGLCFYCDNPVFAGTQLCETHLATSKRRRKAVLNRTKCSNCKCKPPLPDRAYCADCLNRIQTKFKAQSAERKANGICVTCGKAPVAPNRKLCGPCLFSGRTKAKQRREIRLANGLCSTCGKTAHLPNSTACESCLFKLLSHDHFGTTGEADKLKAIFYANGGRCAYTNWPLALGTNASLDHIHPIAKGGSQGVDNVQFAHSVANQMKWSFDESEFLEAVKAIYKHRC